MRASKALAIAGSILLFPVIVVVGYMTVAAATQGFSWSEMDWNRDGTTSISEFYTSMDVAKRPGQRAGCIDYFHLKDGSTVRTRCSPTSPAT